MPARRTRNATAAARVAANTAAITSGTAAVVNTGAGNAATTLAKKNPAAKRNTTTTRKRKQPPAVQPNEQVEVDIHPVPASTDEDAVYEVGDLHAENALGMRNEWANSTALPKRPRIVSVIDPAVRFAEVLEKTLDKLRENSATENNSRLVNRLTTAKELPIFSGDPLEWLHFKEEYELSSELGEYGDRENISRLFKALKGDAREIVNTLLATSRDPAAVINTLDLHYGNKRAVAEKIVGNLKKLPDVDADARTLTHFATELKNATVAFRSLKLPGYLDSPDLIRVVGSKLPIVLKYAYNKYAAGVTGEKSELEKLSNFLYEEARLAVSAGIFNVEITETSAA